MSPRAVSAEQRAVLSVCVYRAYPSLTPAERAVVRPLMIAWARARGGRKDDPPVTTRAAGPVPDKLIRRLGRRDPLADLKRCGECNRLVVDPVEERPA